MIKGKTYIHRDSPSIKAAGHMICWNNDSSDVEIFPYPDLLMESACYSKSLPIGDNSFETTKSQLFINAMHLVVRDGCCPIAVHNKFLELEEYRDGCSDDMLWIFEAPSTDKSRSEFKRDLALYHSLQNLAAIGYSKQKVTDLVNKILADHYPKK